MSDQNAWDMFRLKLVSSAQKICQKKYRVCFLSSCDDVRFFTYVSYLRCTCLYYKMIISRPIMMFRISKLLSWLVDFYEETSIILTFNILL